MHPTSRESELDEDGGHSKRDSAEVKLMRRLRTQASELDPVGARCFLGLAGPEAGGQITLSTLR